MKKIMFNDKYNLTQAVLDGRKTQTRRNFTLALHKKEVGGGLVEVSPTKVYFEDGKWKFIYDDYAFLLPKINYPKYKIGEVIAVAQSYIDCGNLPDYELDEDGFPIMPIKSGYFNKMFVRADLMPYQIRITNVRIERLQDISDEDCLKEGIYAYYYGDEKEKRFYEIPPNGYSFDGTDFQYPTPREAFANLIDKVSGKGTWDSHPYVWVYDF